MNYMNILWTSKEFKQAPSIFISILNETGFDSNKFQIVVYYTRYLTFTVWVDHENHMSLF